MNRWRIALVVSVLLGALLAPGTVAATPAVVPPAATTRVTTLTLVFDNCPACVVSLQRALTVGTKVRPLTPSYWAGQPRKVAPGVYRLRLPSAWTSGLSFNIDASWRGLGDTLGYGVNMATRYVGLPVGGYVTTSKAVAATRGYGCWAGTTSTAVTIHIRVRAFWTRGYAGKVVKDLEAWSYRGLPIVGPASAHLGNQDAWYC
jgi:hypothetical protein